MECNGFCEDLTWYQGMGYVIDFIETARTVQGFLYVVDEGGEREFSSSQFWS